MWKDNFLVCAMFCEFIGHILLLVTLFSWLLLLDSYSPPYIAYFVPCHLHGSSSLHP